MSWTEINVFRGASLLCSRRHLRINFHIYFHITPYPWMSAVPTNCVTLWKLHLPKKGGRYDTASRNGLVSTCLSAGSCLNWCSINRAISHLVRTHSYLWNDSNRLSPLCCRFTVTPEEAECVCVCVFVCVCVCHTPPWESHQHTHTHTDSSHLHWTQVMVEYPADGSCDRPVTDRSGSSPPVG